MDDPSMRLVRMTNAYGPTLLIVSCDMP